MKRIQFLGGAAMPMAPCRHTRPRRLLENDGWNP